MGIELRLWQRAHERELVTARWLQGEASLHRYADIPTQVTRWWVFRALDAVLAHQHTAVIVAHSRGEPAAPAGFVVYQEPKGHPGPLIYWVYTEPLRRRQAVALALLQAVVPGDCQHVTTTALTTAGALALRAARPELATLLHNPFPLWEAAAGRAVGTEKFQRRLMRAFVHAGFVAAHGNAKAIPLDPKEVDP